MTVSLRSVHCLSRSLFPLTCSFLPCWLWKSTILPVKTREMAIFRQIVLAQLPFRDCSRYDTTHTSIVCLRTLQMTRCRVRMWPSRSPPPLVLCRHFDVSTTGQLEEVKEGLGLAFLEKMVSRDELWITATVSVLFHQPTSVYSRHTAWHSFPVC